MDEPGFLLTYPVFLIGRYSREQIDADASLQQLWAITQMGNHSALMLFTEPLFAERIMIAETVVANVVSIDSPQRLADIIRRNRKHFSHVLIDPNPTTRIGRGFPVDEFLLGFESGA